MSNYTAGHNAEQRAAKYLVERGFFIKEMNWKTRYCEIDVVAEKNRRIFFVEVKYRRNTNQGFGMEYVTHKKLQQMRFAAEMWVQNSKWMGEYQLAAISIDGGAITFIEDLE